MNTVKLTQEYLLILHLLEKQLAQKANLGWQGKHTNLVSRKFGSWLFLAEIFLQLTYLQVKKK